MKISLFIYKQLLPINLALSVLFSLNNPFAYPIIFSTIGYAITALLYHYFYKNIKYIYLNAGYTQRKLLAETFLLNLLTGIFQFGILWLLIEKNYLSTL